ncbi:hypothetical protein [Frigoribacterium sp. Leaf44]|uniref:hypothetical protein n=1 Tax=Frigoribacterium sp. Leaf44 TaxID=1736220 RepID=UPI0006F3E17C|nr:hypothetical protein [Frigoribacterium sp. Leaf44]KQN39918.1 hypothetical protein ASE87_14390 [Frigoribacterium sp. Leaf44]
MISIPPPARVLTGAVLSAALVLTAHLPATAAVAGSVASESSSTSKSPSTPESPSTSESPSTPEGQEARVPSPADDPTLPPPDPATPSPSPSSEPPASAPPEAPVETGAETGAETGIETGAETGAATEALQAAEAGVAALTSPLEVLSHADGESYEAGPATFFGSGTPTATVVATNQWGVEMGRATVAVNGRWAFTRNLGPTTRSYELVFRQTLGAESDQKALELFYAGSVELSVGSHVDGQLYSAGPTVFAGHGAPNALVTVVDARLGEIARTTTALSGRWSVGADLVPTLDGYSLTVTQTRRDIDPQRVPLNLEYAAALVPLGVDSHRDGAPYGPGVATFSGRGTVGARITAVNQWNTPMGSARVGVDGRWAFDRNLGPTSSGYEITFTQTRGLTVDSVVVHLTVPVPADLAVTTPDLSGGTVDDGDVMTTFRGTGTPFATLHGVNQWGTAFGDTTIGADGRWEFRRWLAKGTRYDLTFTQVSWTGETVVTEGYGFDVEP